MPAGAGGSPVPGGHQEELRLEAEDARSANGTEFERWWVIYRTRTGRGVGKAETRHAYDRLSNADKLALIERTQAWFAAREALDATGAFVPEAPDPVRFIRKKRWQDEFEASAGRGDGGGPAVRPDQALYIQEAQEHARDPLWDEYEKLVTSHEIPVGWQAFVASRKGAA